MEDKCGNAIVQTIEYYERNASAFIESIIDANISGLYKPFEALLVPDCGILDLSCRSGSGVCISEKGHVDKRMDKRLY